MHLTNVNDVANLVREERQAKGWTQADLALYAGVSRDWLIGLEKAKSSVELGLVLRTLKALNISILANPKSDQPTTITEQYLQNIKAR